MRQKRAVLLCVLCWLVCLLTGCGGLVGSGSAQVEELLRAPRSSGDTGALQKALNDWLGESAQLRYPLSGDQLSPFVMADWDGDGREDAAILYLSSQTPNVSIAVLQRGENGAWRVITAAEGLSDTVDSVQIARLRLGEARQLVVGYGSSQGDEYLAVYDYENGRLETILEQAYTGCILTDITGSGCEDLVLLPQTEPDEPMQIALLTADYENGGFRQAAVLTLSAERFTGVAGLASGRGSYSGHYVVVDGYTSVSGNSLASVLLRFNERTRQMEQAFQIEADELYNASLRSVAGLTSRDLDGDGTVEIPIQPEGLGQIGVGQNRRLDFIAWMDYTNRSPLKSFGIVDEELGYYLELPAEWRGDLLLVEGAGENVWELRDSTGETLYLSLRTTSLQADSVGWTRLGILASRQLQVRLGPGVKLDAGKYRLTRAMHMI